MKLLIVESPGKIKTLESILGPGWKVAASCGHIRDLPDSGYGLEPPTYQLKYVATKKEIIAKLKKLCAEASDIFLASDPDREGEAISWHLLDTLKLREYKRVTFSSITPEAVQAAIRQPRKIDMDLVHAQEARRALDRLCGYKVSLPLSKAVGEVGMSAGRVQSPAVRLVVERERRIKDFVQTFHFGVDLGFSGGWFASWLPKEGWLSSSEPYLLDRGVAEAVAKLRTLEVISFEEQTAQVSPPAPFTTSSLQQAASNALKLKPKRTMELAQKLYEGGHITYMRTDNPNLSETAITEIRAFCTAQGWALPASPRSWKSKAGAQEAHEAIRPTHIEVAEAGDSEEERALYQLIRLRAIASQLPDAVFNVRVSRLSGAVNGQKAVFEAKGRTLKEKGWKGLLAADAALADETAEAESSNPVPVLRQGEKVTAESGAVKNLKTEPPARFKEASLIRELERRGIGRPATYAAIMENIQARNYIQADKKGCLSPTQRGEKLVDALVGTFSFLDLDFTGQMEAHLDSIAAGKLTYEACVDADFKRLTAELQKFLGNLPLIEHIACPACGDNQQFNHIFSRAKGWDFWGCKSCGATFPNDNGKPGAQKAKSQSESRATDFVCPKCKKPLTARPTKNGGIWFGCSGYPKCKVRFWAKADGTPDFDNPPKN